ncbi:transient receptor potential cation channel subfamily V member 6 [Patella vulgata]|uniref:transient receptor potential cation channel subfamily V member 6 n=1 Tax=Patella vulgata TaxID=6465 RepID=UPI00217F7BF6|nr:transient receptor potential cation channel subfamily V member 6 [Patella vulgata]
MGNIADLFSRNKDCHTWKIQNRETLSNPVYSYVNLDGTGILLDLLRDENGRKKVRDMIADEITSKYITGQDEMCIEQIEEQRELGRFRVISTAIQRSVSALSRSRKFNVEVTANQIKPQCWKENKRGGVGETSFHLCFLKGTPEHLEIARIFLEVHPSMANDVYTGDEYRGEGGLHLAIAKGNLEAVQLLVENGADVNQRATGQFFQPEDVKQGKDRKQTNYEGYAYYGEYPLSFAACFQHTDIYDYLIEHGADPYNKDDFGNTVLHMAVIHNQSKIYRHAVKNFQNAVESKNKAGLTPLTLASKLGRPEIFQEMLEISSTQKWKFGNIICSQYPLDALDSIGPKGETDWESALMTILDGETDEHAEMLEGPVMSQLLREKWKTYAKTRFWWRMGISVTHLLTITVAVYTRPNHGNLLNFSELTNVIRVIAECFMCLGCVFNLVMEEAKVVKELGLRFYFRNCKYAPDNTIYTLSCVLILICIPLRFTRSVDAEEILLIIAVPGAFCILLFFARALAITGPFVVMVYKMLTRDMFRFAIVYFFFCIGFGLGLSLLFRDIEDQSINPTNFTDNKEFAIERFSTWNETILTLIQMSFGEFQYETFNEARSPEITKLIFTAFITLVPILLLNMLIAMMGNTYHNIRVKAEKEWRKQRAKIIIVLESSIRRRQLLANRVKYSDGRGSLVVIRSGQDAIEDLWWDTRL